MLFQLILISTAAYTALAQNGSVTNEPCAQVSAMVVPMRQANPKVTPIIPGELAFNCLQSVPLNSEQALGVTQGLLPYAEFQSDRSYKKAPPSGYPYPAVDLVGDINRVASNLQSNNYSNEWTWQMDVFKSFMSAKDGHYRYAGDLIVRPVRFTRGISLVSVSMDGTTAPQLYITGDVLKMNTTASFKPSAITKINGMDSITFAQMEADKGFQQDPDAAFNTLMYNRALDFTPGQNVNGFFAGDGRYGFMYPGANTTIEFANGTTFTSQTQALIPGNFTGVTDGRSAFQKFCVPAKAVAATPGGAPASPIFKPGDAVNNTARLKGYPLPQVSSSDGQISGYYLPNSDVGVLAMNSFEPNVPAEFQAVMQTMLAEMKRDGKTKLIVDLQGNGGGIVVNGFDAFRQLFPATQDVLTSRQRSGPVFQTLAQLTSDKFANFSIVTSNDLDAISIYEQPFNVRFGIDQNRTNFTTFASKFGPSEFNGDQFTNLAQLNFSDPNFTINETTGAGMDITGYGTRKNFTQQPFPAENVVMLYDGTCASTCTLFSELMRNLGSVKSIALGGRPGTSQIQAIGGVKGSQSLSFAGLKSFTDFYMNTTANPGVTSAQKVVLTTLTDLPSTRALDTGVNFADHILAGNIKDGIPAQFVQEPADCRLFYTPAMIQNVTAMWNAAAGAAWGGQKCVAGAITQITKAQGVDQPNVAAQAMGDMMQAAADARTYLQEVQMKAAIEPVQRSAAWKEVHVQSVPNMYMS